MAVTLPTNAASVGVEARSGLDPWGRAELPLPPRPTGLGWLRVVGPGVIVLGAAIGSGEFLLGPAVFVRHGLSLLWITVVATVLQTIFNTEVMRYTLATGEPVFTGFMRTRPSSTLWAWVYVAAYFLQQGWPGFAATAAAAIFFLFSGRLPTGDDGGAIYGIGVAIFLACAAVLSIGKRIERTLELLNWVLIGCILVSFLALAILFVPSATWLSAVVGLGGVDSQTWQWQPVPAGADFFLLGALVAFSGAGGVVNLTLSNWARDRGYGMSERAGYISGAVGGTKVRLAHTGFMFADTPESMTNWRGWWRIVRADQWGIFCTGAIAGMILPALLYVTFLPRGTDIQGLGIGAALASGMGARAGAAIGALIAVLGAWILVKTQLDVLDGIVRGVTDMLWTGNRRLREWPGADVRFVYYTVLATLVVWALIAMRLAQPIMLVKISANAAGVTLVVASLHLLYVNTHLLPPHIRPPMWRRAALVAVAIFYGLFAAFALLSL
jgi:Mn2+/Fe2+ NRAMP family transporter